MDYKCWCCPAEATWVCDCPQDSRSCNKHHTDHRIKFRKCNSEYIKDDLVESDNALRSLESECTKVAQKMMDEIEKCYLENINYLCLKRFEAKDLIYKRLNHEADAIKNWAKTLNLIARDRNQFIFSVRRLLSIDDAQSKIDTDNEKLKKDLRKNKKKLERALKNIRKLEININECNEKNNELQYQIKEFSEKAQGEEKKTSLTIMEFIGKNNKGNYKRLNFEQVKFHIVELEFESYKKTFIENEHTYIMQISYTEDQQYLFVCKFKADCKN